MFFSKIVGAQCRLSEPVVNGELVKKLRTFKYNSECFSILTCEKSCGYLIEARYSNNDHQSHIMFENAPE
jgi:hypothetical protein